MKINQKLYNQRLKDIRWFIKSNALKEMNGNVCQICGRGYERKNYSYLIIHHKYYIEDRDPWNYLEDAYSVLCNYCHKEINHKNIRHYDNSNADELRNYPFILTRLFLSKGKEERIAYNEYFDIRYYGWIIDCDYQTKYRQGDGRFDYELIVREVMNGESSFSSRKYGEPYTNKFTLSMLMLPDYYY